MLSPVALYLADVLEDAGIPAGIAEAAAIELRRLHAQRDALLDALKTLPQSLASTDEDLDRWLVKARAAIAKAEEQT